MDHASAKLVRKGCDLLVVNDVSEGRVFNATDSEAVIIGADGFSREVPSGPKADIAHAVWDAVVGLTA
jgi:phosphopantothenoylcysteine decarboxylase/phosphopantothenate--cysteine ligase